MVTTVGPFVLAHPHLQTHTTHTVRYLHVFIFWTKPNVPTLWPNIWECWSCGDFEKCCDKLLKLLLRIFLKSKTSFQCQNIITSADLISTLHIFSGEERICSVCSGYLIFGSTCMWTGPNLDLVSETWCSERHCAGTGILQTHSPPLQRTSVHSANKSLWVV